MAATARKYGISEQTIYRWCQNIVAFLPPKLNAKKPLSSENSAFKRLTAGREPKIQALTNFLKSLGRWRIKESSLFRHGDYYIDLIESLHSTMEKEALLQP